MTGIALCQLVFAAQGVFRILGVVEQYPLPVLVAVTGLAFRAKAALMALVVVVFLVTGDAGRRGILEIRVAVTVLADYLEMLPGKRELRFAVIKPCLLPV